MEFHFSVFVVILFVSAVFSGVAAYLAWQRRFTPGAFYFFWIHLAVSLWSLLAVFELGFQSIELKILMSQLSYISIVSIGPLWLLFTINLTGYGKAWTKFPKQAMFWILSAIVLVLVFTNGWHQLIWSKVVLLSSSFGNVALYEHGPAFLLNLLNIYLAMVIGMVLLIMDYRKRKGSNKTQFHLLLLSIVIPWFSNFLYVTRLNPWPEIDLTPFAFALSGVFASIAIFRYKLFELLPQARTQVISTIQNGILILDKENRIVEANPAIIEFTGRFINAGELAQDALSAWPKLLEALNKEGNQNFEEQVQINNVPQWIKIKISEIAADQKDAKGRLVIFENVTQSKSAEASIQDLKKQMTEVIDFLPDPTLVIDIYGKVLIWNKAMEKLTGVKAADMIGKGDYEHALPIYQTRRPLLADLVLKPDETILASYKNLEREGERLSANLSVTLPDGKTYDLWAVAKPLYNFENVRIGAIETYKDVSTIRAAEREMEMSQTKLQAIIENTDDIVLFIDPEYKVSIFNQAYANTIEKFFKIKVEKGLNAVNILPEEIRDWWLENFTKAMSGQKYTTEFTFEPPEQPKVVMEVSFNPVIINKQVVGVTQFSHNITHRKEQEDALNKKIAELAQANDLMVGRELKMVELKKQMERIQKIMAVDTPPPTVPQNPVTPEAQTPPV